LPGGENHDLFTSWLDRFVAFNDDLKVGAFRWLGFGTHVPIVFRPFHEHTGSWFWWGGSNVTAEEYIQLWRFTVEYLRDVKGVHNLLYAYSPDKFQSLEEYLEYYPGDEYVDILGVDDYSIGRPGGDVETTAWRLRTVTRLAAERNKVAAMTETGSDRIPDPEWWTGRLLKALDADEETRRVAWVLVWRNAHKGHHHAPYPGHPSAADFVEFYNSPLIVFADGLPDMYR
jgi:mannan endo-1,4-beta-mannosidase